MVVDNGASNDKTVKDLVTMKPNVQSSRKEAFRDSNGIQYGSGDVENAHQDQPAQGHFVQ